MSKTHSLIHDTLYGKPAEGVATSCFVTNKPGVELASVTKNVLADLEVAIREVDRNIDSPRSYHAQFPGLDYLLGAYLINATRHNEVYRSVDFIRSCGVLVFCRSLLMIPAFFGITDRGYAFGVALPEELHDFVDASRTHHENEIASTARRVYDILRREHAR